MASSGLGAGPPRGDDEPGGGANRLWIERAATRLGLDRVAGPTRAPYLLLGSVYFVDVPILSSIRYVQTGFHPYLVNPASASVIVLAIFALWSSRRLRDAFEETVAALPPGPEASTAQQDSMNDDRPPRSTLSRALLRFGRPSEGTGERERLEPLVDPRLTTLALGTAWILYVAWITTNPTIQRLILVHEGPLIGGIKYGLLLPGVYLPLGAEFFVTYFGIIVLLPLEIRDAGLVNFQDPHGFGGLRPVGDLIRSASTYYLFGLGGYVAGIGLGFLLGEAGYVPSVGVVTTGFIVAGIFLGVLLFVYPVLVLHDHMKGAKHEKIQAIAAEVEQHGPPDDQNMFPETKVPTSLEEGNEYVHLYIKLRRVENMREYPIDTTHLQDLVLAVIFPLVAQLTVDLLASVGWQ